MRIRTKLLFIVTAVAEGVTGLALLVSPALLAKILIGTPFDTLADSVVGRVAGAAQSEAGSHSPAPVDEDSGGEAFGRMPWPDEMAGC